MSSVGEMTADSDSPPSCSQLSSSDDEKRKTGALYKANLNDTFDRQIEVKSLQSQLVQLTSELASERESAVSFRRKLTQANKEKFEQASRFNEETCKLHTQNAALQAKLERQAEFTEQLEFELDKTRKQLERERRSSENRAAQNTESVEQLEELLSEAKTKIFSLESQSDDSEKGMLAQLEQLKETIADRDRILRDTVQEQQNVIAERNTLTEMAQQQQETIQEHRKEFSELKSEFDKVREHLCEANAQVKSLTVAEQEHRAELEETRQACKELSEAIESEKTNHLESKFNGELVQLKINDLENSLEHQKCVNDGLQENVDNLTGQLREVEKAYNDEMSQHRGTKSRLEKCEKEYALSQRQLQAELTDKRTLVTNLKQQLDTHQSNVDDLKTELNRARKRQQYFEETYGGSMRELELLVANFDLASSDSRSGRREVRSHEDDKPMSPNVILDMIKHTLRIYKQNLEETTAELKKLSATFDEVSKENSGNKDKLWAKQKALEEAQRSLSQNGKDVELLRRTVSEQEQRLTSLRDDLQTVKKEYDALQAKYTGLSNDLTNTKMAHLQQDEQKMRFIHGLYQRLIVPSTTLSSSKSSGKLGKVQPYEKFKWDDLSEMVLEQTVTLLSQVAHLREASTNLDKDLQNRDERLDSVKKEYEGEISKMATLMEKNSEEWGKERQAMQLEYHNLQADSRNQQDMSQKAYDEAWEQVRQTTSTMERLEKDSVDLKTRISMLQKHNSSLLCAFALMCGAYYPLLKRSRQLTKQRNILEDQLQRYDQFKKQVCTLLETLSSEGLGGDSGALSQAMSRHARLRFRRAVLVVMAIKRLQLLSQKARRVFTFTDYENTQALVCLGSLKSAKRRRVYAGDYEETDSAEDILSESDIIDWLSNKQMISTVMSCTEDVMDALKRYSSKDKVCRPGFIVSAARTSFKKLVGHLEVLYPVAGADNAPSPHKERLTMVKLLNRGLHDVMSSSALEHKFKLLPSQQVLTCLQERVLGFIKLLHDSELERKRLRTRAMLLTSSEQQLVKVEQAAENMELEMAVLRNQAERMVSVERFDGVVEELNQTLVREKQAQQLLDEQSKNLREMSRRLTEEEVRRSEHENQLKATLQFAEKSKSDVTSKTEAIQQLKCRLSRLELERTQLQDNVHDAEQALRTAAKDREYLSIYVKSISVAFEKCRSDVIHKDISKLLSSKNLLPDCKPSGEMLAVQSLVNAFTDSLRAVHNHLGGLNEEIASHKKHITRLKDELSAACKRQMGGPVVESGYNHHSALPREDEYNRLQSTRLGHYKDKDITPRFDKSIDLDSVTDFMSMRNEPEFSNGDMGSVKSLRRKTPSGQEMPAAKSALGKPQGSSFRTPSSVPSRRKHEIR